MAEDEVTGKHAKLGNLAEELAAGLRERVPAHVVPLAGPPGNIGRIRLELTRQSERNDQLEHKALDGDGGDHAEEHAWETESFEEEHDFEQGEHHHHCNAVGDCR